MRKLIRNVVLLPEKAQGDLQRESPEDTERQICGENQKGQQDAGRGKSRAVPVPVDIGIEGDRIAFIRPHQKEPQWDKFPSPDKFPLSPGSEQEAKSEARFFTCEDGCEVIEGYGRLALPGLVNAHTHLGMTLLRGYGDDLPLMRWLEEKMWPVEDRLTPEDVYWASMLAIGEMLKAGITTCADMYFHMEETARAVVESGIRASLSRGVQGLGGSGRRGLLEAASLCRQWEGEAEGRITTMIGPHAPFTCPPDFLREVIDQAIRLEVPLHIHVAETTREVEIIRQQYDTTPLGMLARYGVLQVPVTAVHCVHFTPEDIDLARENDVRIVHCPASNMKLASGIAPLPDMLAAGLTVGLGTDSAASNNKLDLWEEMRLAALLHKACRQEATVVPASTVIEMATAGGAAALRFNQVGRLQPGWKADLVLVEREGLHWQPPCDLASSVVYAANRSDVSLVMVNGRVICQKGELLTVDEEKTRAEFRRCARRLGLI